MSRFVLTLPPSSPLEVIGGGNQVSLYILTYGPAGDSAYQVAVANGFVGSVEQWLASLKGSQYEHQQTTPSASWVVNHNFGVRPNVQVTTLGGVQMWAEVIHASTNQVLVYFDSPATGLAICS